MFTLLCYHNHTLNEYSTYSIQHVQYDEPVIICIVFFNLNAFKNKINNFNIDGVQQCVGFHFSPSLVLFIHNHQSYIIFLHLLTWNNTVSTITFIYTIHFHNTCPRKIIHIHDHTYNFTM